MKWKGLYISTIIILVLLNLGTLTFLWINRPDRGEGGRGKDVERFLDKKLKMTPEQQKAYRILREQHRFAMRAFQQKDKALHNQFFDLIPLSMADSTLITSFADSIALNRKQIELLTFKHFQRIRQILDPEQRKKFDEIFGETLKMVLPPPPAIPPPPPPPPVKR